MKNKKTTLFYLCFLLAGISSAQSHYMVQWDRLQNEISYFQIDYRKTEDFILFTIQLAEKIKYYNFENKVDGNWK